MFFERYKHVIDINFRTNRRGHQE